MVSGLNAAEPIPRPLLKNSLHGKPNFILILAESLGHADLPAYGAGQARLPHLDRMAAEGVIFSQAYTASSEPGRSLIALLGGKLTPNPQPDRPGAGRPAGVDLGLPKLLRQNGYLAGMLGWWPAGPDEPPLEHGFEEWFGFFEPEAARAQFPRFIQRNQGRVEVNPPTAPTRFDAPLMLLTAATNYIKTTRLYPFLLVVSYASPATNQARQAWLERLDRDVGALRAALQQHRLDTQTLFLVTGLGAPAAAETNRAARGAASSPWRRGDHGLYEGDLRVPLLACLPGRLAAGVTNHQPVTLTDWLPTLAELAEAQATNKTDGISILPALLGRRQTNQHQYLYWENPRTGAAALRRGLWKMVQSLSNAPPELYHLERDPMEKEDVAARHPEKVRELEGLLKTLREGRRGQPARPTN